MDDALVFTVYLMIVFILDVQHITAHNLNFIFFRQSKVSSVLADRSGETMINLEWLYPSQD